MSDHDRQLIGWVAAIVSFMAYPPYIVEFIGEPTKKFWATRWMWKYLPLEGKTNPHLASWLIWALLQVVIFNGSRQQGASATTWIVLMYLIGSLMTAAFVWFYGDRNWETLDIFCACLGGVSLALLLVVKAPFWALLLAINTDGIASIPTLVGVTKKPADEPRLGWTIFLLGAGVNLLAVKTWNFQEAGFTIYLLVLIGYICGQVWLRPNLRRSESRTSPRFIGE